MTELKTAAPSSTLDSPPPEAVRPRPSILMVDDQPARLLTYEAMLSGLGVDCVRALSGLEALEKLLKQEFAVILLDVEMPGMDGFELARTLREHPRLERTPIIFVTGVHVSELDQLKGYEVGAIDYISVPVVAEILRSKVALLVELHQRRSELQALNRSLQETREKLEADHATRLAEKDAQLQAAFENHPDQLTVVMRPHRNEQGQIDDWVYLNANSNALKLLGIDRESFVGRRISEVLGDRAKQAIERCNRVHSSETPLRYEARFGATDMAITLFPAGNDMVISSAMDVTERKRAENALAETERRNRALFENAPVGIAHNAMDGRFEYVNQAFCDLVGYTADELCKLTWQHITHPDDIESDRVLGGRVISGELPYYTVEKRYMCKDGKSVWVSSFGNFVRDDAGRPVQGVAIIVDITERKLAEQAVRESRERLVMAKSAAQLGIYDWDIVANVVRWDDRVYELWGIDSTTAVNYEAFISGVHPDDISAVQASVDASLDPNGEGRYHSTYRVVNGRDGLTRWIEAAGNAVFEHGRAVRLIGTVQDITEKKVTEQKLRDNDRRKDEFLAMLAHELRNPIAPIRNAAEVLARLVGAEAPQRTLVEMIQRQGAHLSRILDGLLDAARITQGRIELRREVVSLVACAEHAMESVSSQVQSNQLNISFTRNGNPLYVFADRVRLEQCIGNLLSNAAKFTDAHGTVSVRLFVDGPHAVVEVKDSGIGIAPEFLPHVFDLFAQSERALDRAEGGLGVGLSVCKQLIEMQGGSVSATSEGIGRGSTFTLRVPLHDKPFELNMIDATGIESGRRVLVVDDNRDAADSLSMCLQLDGHSTKAVYSAESAIAQLKEFAPDVVLLDIGLPRMDGYQVARHIRAASSRVRMIALTGYGQEEDKQRTAAAGFDAHLTKPVDMTALRVALKVAD